MAKLPHSASPTEAFVGRVFAALEVEERSVSWLARKIGIADSTLRYQLGHPEGMPLSTSLLICGAIDVSIEREAPVAAVA